MDQVDQGSPEASPFKLANQGQPTREEVMEMGDVVGAIELVAPMSAVAWRTLATWLEETEEGVVGRLWTWDEDAARVGEREVVRRCWKRIRRMSGLWTSSMMEFSDERFEKYWPHNKELKIWK